VRSFKLAAASLLAVALALPATAQGGTDWSSSEAVGLGPLILRAQSPLSVLRLAPMPLAPITTPRGDWNVGAVVNWNNYFAVDPGGLYVIDAESVGVTLGASYGVAKGIDVQIAAPVSYRGGGVLDAFVESFETTIGVPNEVRTAYPRDQYVVRFVGADGEVLERTDADAGWGIEDAALGVRFQLLEGDRRRPAVLVFAGVKAPIGRETALRSTGGTDLLIGVAAGQRLGRFHLYGSLAAMEYEETELVGYRLTQHQWSAFLGAELRASGRSSWLLQATVTSPAALDFGDFAKRTYEVTLGYKRLLREDWLLEASVLENLFVFDNSPDVGFHVGVVWRSHRAGGPRAPG